MASEPQFADGIDPERLRPSLNALQSNGWTLDEDKIGIKKTFYFKSYFKAVVCFSIRTQSTPSIFLAKLISFDCRASST
jgi:hypothetical protein